VLGNEGHDIIVFFFCLFLFVFFGFVVIGHLDVFFNVSRELAHHPRVQL
jgi:hypothetical protein